MGFFWNGEQLFTKRAVVESKSETSPSAESNSSVANPWTSFYLSAREPEEIPNLTSFSKFLATAIAFTENLCSLKVYTSVEDQEQPSLLFQISKVYEGGKPLEQGALDKLTLTTPNGMFRVVGIGLDALTMTIERTQRFYDLSPELRSLAQRVLPSVLQSDSQPEQQSPFKRRNLFDKIFSSFTTLSGYQTANDAVSQAVSSDESAQAVAPAAPKKDKMRSQIRLGMVRAKLKVEASKQSYGKQFLKDFQFELRKLPPPETTAKFLLPSPEDKPDASVGGADDAVWGDLELKSKQGRIFIGFATHQTTGCSCHIAAQLIPTVERESIDFYGKALSLWNRELLAGLGVRRLLLHDSK
jgi:hypothetical protein